VGLAGAAAAAGAAASGLAVYALQTLLGPPARPIGRISEAFVYTKYATPQWWNDLADQPVRVTDFGLWQGATAVWRGLFKDGTYVPGTGLPALVIRIPRDDTNFQAPTFPLPSLPGFRLYYDDPLRDLRLVAVFDRCVHLCCYPSWHTTVDVGAPRDYEPSSPTYEVYGQDPIRCLCHEAQFDPLLLTTDTDPSTGVTYVGAQVVHGPASRALPVIPVRVQDNVLEGGMPDPRWYTFCAELE